MEITDNLDKYEIKGEVSAGKNYIRLSVPIDFLKDKDCYISSFSKGKERFPELKQYGIPTNVEWEAYLTDVVIGCAFPDSHRTINVKEVKDLKVVDDKVTIDCLVD